MGRTVTLEEHQEAHHHHSYLQKDRTAPLKPATFMTKPKSNKGGVSQSERRRQEQAAAAAAAAAATQRSSNDGSGSDISISSSNLRGAITRSMADPQAAVLQAIQELSLTVQGLSTRMEAYEGAASTSLVARTPVASTSHPRPSMAQQYQPAQPCPPPPGNDAAAPEDPDAARWALCEPPVTTYGITYSAEKTLNTSLKMKGLLPTLRGRDLHDATTCLRALAQWPTLTFNNQQYFAHRIQLLHIASVKGWQYAVTVDSAASESEWELPEAARFLTPAPYPTVARYSESGSRGRGRGTGSKKTTSEKKK